MEENAYARKIPKPCTIVLFGVTGHLSRNKILPAFYDLFHRGLMPAGFALLGFARREWGEGEFASWAEEEIKKNCRTKFDEGVFSLLRPHFYFAKGTFDNEESFLGLKKIIGRAGEEQGTGGRTLFYLSIPPANFPMVIEKLKGAGLAESENPMKKVMVEKPFGRDLKSARNLDSLLKSAFLPSQIFRVDHYLGK
ncbi:MAG: glucose-6-phosphate dehydrogenase, partial [Aeriscardovia sp.]|nr:glucose-6-phosphate dehydrogenase [Aeriscardovia sp.]